MPLGRSARFKYASELQPLLGRVSSAMDTLMSFKRWSFVVEITTTNHDSSLPPLCDRMDWLNQGSRALFGTLCEDQLYILIDTSASMQPSLGFVKQKLFVLMQVSLNLTDSINHLEINTYILLRIIILNYLLFWMVTNTNYIWKRIEIKQGDHDDAREITAVWCSNVIKTKFRGGHLGFLTGISLSILTELSTHI